MLQSPSKGEWIEIAGGIAIDFNSMSLEGMTVLGLLEQLANINRHNGATSTPISVLQHSLWVSECLNYNPEHALAGLVHDFHEVIVGDMATPIKQHLRNNKSTVFDTLEIQAEMAMREWLGIPAFSRWADEMVKHADTGVLMAEREMYRVKGRAWSINVKPALIGPMLSRSKLLAKVEDRLYYLYTALDLDTASLFT